MCVHLHPSSSLGRFMTGTLWIAGIVDSRTGVDAVEKRKFFASNGNQRSFV
jgi:hypothetical protein